MIQPTAIRQRAIGGLFFLICVWSFGYVFFAKPKALPPSEQLTLITQSDDFRAGQRNAGPDGCLALPHQEAELIMMGSSHTYKGVDAVLLERQSTLPTGICGLPRWSAGHIAPFTRYLDRSVPKLSRLVWVIDASSLTRFRTDEARTADAVRIFGDAAFASQTKNNWRSRVDEGEPPLSIDNVRSQTLLSNQKVALVDLDLAAVDAMVAHHQDAILFRPILFKRSLEQVYQADTARDEVLSEFCQWLTQRKIRLDIVGSPVPDITAEVAGYDEQRYGEQLRSLLPCAETIILRDLEGWGLDSRHFVNRKMLDDYDYGLWEADPETFGERLSNLDASEIYGIFDSDHMNAVGAEIFTREIIHTLKIK